MLSPGSSKVHTIFLIMPSNQFMSSLVEALFEDVLTISLEDEKLVDWSWPVLLSTLL